MGEIDHSLSNLDVLIVGAGFSGIYQLCKYRKLGYNVHVFDAAKDLGGVWYWNCYPGARVDSEVPIYEFSDPELWKDWTWTERFPGWEEIRQYFTYVEKKLDVRKDISFGTYVVSAHWDSNIDRWTVTTANGLVVKPRFLSLCMGFAAKPYTPNFKGLETFKGICHHTAEWPQEGIDMKGKRVGVIGTGASGVQVIQEVGKEVAQLSVFQRTPNIALPMVQKKLTKEEQLERKQEIYSAIYRRLRQTHLAFHYPLHPKKLFDATPEERLLHWEDTWTRGGFTYLVSNYADFGIDEKANAEVYAFWRKKTRSRINDPRMQDILAPEVPPHYIGAKRSSLEQSYYEVYNLPHVSLTDTSANPIEEITPTGIRTADGVHHDLDIIVMATGFDGLTGSFTNIDIRGTDGTTIKEKWAKGCHTNLGMSVAGFPNMFFTYGPQGPIAFCNGPTCCELQGDWIISCIKYMMDNNLSTIDATAKAQEEWRNIVFESSKKPLKAKGWWIGSNIPGKPEEPLSYYGGNPAYFAFCEEKAKKGYEGFTISKKSTTEKQWWPFKRERLAGKGFLSWLILGSILCSLLNFYY
ncbi:hypothetical protein VKT23_006040 [Stygiomarasmius scandens]|uniref:Cyclopentanone 1,2-monooxygenase n=1 Tax=Marasmiellus scandens TaxID=2682957 RepID=A0ABR1JVG0_9AGAR